MLLFEQRENSSSYAEKNTASETEAIKRERVCVL